MFLTICLRKEVATEAIAQQLYELVVQKMSDHPEVDVKGSVSTVLPLEPEVT